MACLRSEVRMGAIFFSFISFVFLLASLASGYWVQGPYQMGLWTMCMLDFPCFAPGMDVPAYIHATRAFMLMAAIAGAISFFGLCSSCCHPHVGSISLVKISAIASFIAGICALLAMAIFTGVFSNAYTWNSVESWYNWSAGLGWASGPIFLIAGGLAYSLQSKSSI